MAPGQNPGRDLRIFDGDWNMDAHTSLCFLPSIYTLFTSSNETYPISKYVMSNA